MWFLAVAGRVAMSEKRTRRMVGFSTSTDNEYEVPDLLFLRRKSSAGLRAFMCSAGSEGCASRDSLRSIVVTPDSIPQFTIPKLAVEDCSTHSAKAKETQPGQDMVWKLIEDLTDPLHLSSSSVSSSSSSSSSLHSSSPVLGRKAQRSISDPDNRRRASVRCIPCASMESDQCSDPATRGALSLPHLAKITTPYGFVTLSQSPQMANEEELFLQTGYRSWASDKKKMPLRNLSVETEGSSSGRTLPVQRHTNANSHQVSRGISNSEPSVGSGTSPSPATASRPKQSFWGVLRKHLSKPKVHLNTQQNTKYF